MDADPGGKAMRIKAAAFLLAGLATWGSVVIAAQDATPSQSSPVLVRTLTLVSSDLAATDRQRIVSAFQGGAYPPQELAERVRQALRDVGFYKATAEAPQLTAINESTQPRSADVSIRVTPGAQYRLTEIHFSGAADFTKNQLVYTPEQLRAQFRLEPGSLFNATAIGQGLMRVRDLYLTKGYADFASIPKPEIDETHHTIGLTIVVDKGRPYYFGRLILDGVEPHAGDANSLLGAWSSLQSRPFDPKALASWLAKNAPFWADSSESMQHISTAPNPVTQLMDVQLKLP
jgi:hypothetical protein